MQSNTTTVLNADADTDAIADSTAATALLSLSKVACVWWTLRPTWMPTWVPQWGPVWMLMGVQTVACQQPSPSPNSITNANPKPKRKSPHTSGSSEFLMVSLV
jgi:hypothetical protein